MIQYLNSSTVVEFKVDDGLATVVHDLRLHQDLQVCLQYLHNVRAYSGQVVVVVFMCLCWPRQATT